MSVELTAPTIACLKKTGRDGLVLGADDNPQLLQLRLCCLVGVTLLNGDVNYMTSIKVILMVRMLPAVLLLSITTSGFADSEVTKIHKKIDQSVWKTFQAAFEALDGDALNSVYAEEVLRVTPDGLDVAEDFKKANRTRFLKNRERGDGIELDFWFDTRHTDARVSYDTGFYRVTLTSSSGEQSYAYGQFHIVLNNIDGHWKIVQDWDTASIGGQPITADDFNRQQPIRF